MPERVEHRPGPLIAGAGIAGLAVGFGAQSLVRDFLAGMFILMEDQFGVGDVVDVGDTSGTIEKVSLRTTTPPGRGRRGVDGSQRGDPPDGQPLAALGARHPGHRCQLRHRHRPGQRDHEGSGG